MTKQQGFKLFKKECLKWAKRWGLEDWRYDFLLSDTAGDDATVSPNLVDHIITFRFNRNGRFSVSLIKEVAKHEMAHVLLGELRALGMSRFITPDEFNAAEHRVVIKLEALL